MFARRTAALLAFVLAYCTALVAPAWATGDATYPPAVQGNGSGVSGVGTGVDTSSGAEAASGSAQGGLAHTGFTFGIVGVALALLVIGVALLVVARRRRQA